MKRKLTSLILAAVTLLAVFSSGWTVNADSRYYSVEGYTVNVDVQPDGSANIEERITYQFNGDFNGVLRDIDFSSTDGIQNVKLYVDDNGTERELSVNSENSLDADGPSGTYNMVAEGNLERFKVYEKSSNQSKTFIYRYTLLSVCTRYNDIAEFNRKIIDSGWTVALGNIVVNIQLPEGASASDIKVYGHGPLTGKSEIIDGRNVQFTLDYLPPGNWMETLVLFPTPLIPQAGRVVNKDALAGILANEAQLADEANKQREEARRQVEEYQMRQEEQRKQQEAQRARDAAIRPIGSAVGATVFCLWFVLIIWLYFKYDKEFKPSFEGKYYRELPGEYTPAEMSVLMSMGSVDTRDITATLMDLVRKEQLLLNNDTYVKHGFFKDKEVQDYSLAINPKAPNVSLKRHEAFLMDWFLGSVGNGYSVRLDDISDYCRSTSGARHFTEDYSRWQSLAKAEAGKNNFLDETCSTGRTIGVLSALACLGLGILVVTALKSTFGVALVIQAVILLIYSASFKRRTAYGNEQHAMWHAFKNFLKDFSNLEKAEMPSIVMWEHYLVYAISLGVAKEVIRQLPLVFTDTDLQNTRLTFMYGYSFNNFAAFTNAFDTTVSSVDSAISNAFSVANSTNSSASGGGGGFSGGGGGGSSGGGGGGGGGGAF